jgi:beta-glucosidase
VLVGNYDGTPSQPVTILSGILSRARASGVNVTYAPGGFFKEAQSESDVPATDDAYLAQAIDAAKRADAVILVEGLNPNMEGENDDRDSIELPVAQDRLARAVVAVGKPVVLVLTAGSALAMPWEAAHVRAILYAWYPGEEGGTAVARVLFGDVDPAGRLPMTFYQSTAQLPAFDDYSMRGRTYRYFTGDPLYGFGYGLSYTTFRYSRLRVAESHPIAGHPLHVTIDETNSGVRSGDDVVELYVAFPEALPETPRPIRSLVGLARIALLPHENKSVAFTIDARSLTLVDAAGSRIAVPGPVDIQAGGEQPDRTGRYPSPQDGLTTGILIHASS